MRPLLGKFSKTSKCPGALPRVRLTRSADLLIDASPLRAFCHCTLALVTQIRPRNFAGSVYQRGKKEVSSLLVDAVNVVLSLDSDARTPDYLAVVGGALRALQVGAAVHPVARVDDNSRLVGAQVSRDAGIGASQADDDGVLRGIVD